jgi:hypothetical protein
MSRRALTTVVAILLPILLFGTGAATSGRGGNTAATPIHFDVQLSPDLVSPLPSGDPLRATGRLRGTLTRHRRFWARIEFRLTLSKLTSQATAAHVHYGERGQRGPMLFDLCGAIPTRTRCSSRRPPFRGSTAGTVVIPAPASLEDWAIYVDVHTKRHPKGELRAQILGTSAAQLSAHLEPGLVVVKPTGVRPGARGTFTASFWPYGAGLDQARWSLSTMGLSGPALKAHIHTGRPGQNGPVLLELCRGGRCNLSGTSFHALPMGFVKTIRLRGAYVDVHTAINPRGELRGQIVISG